MAARGCRVSPDSFCYICGSFAVKKKQQRNITKFVKKVYFAYFGVKLGDQDKSWAPHKVCSICVEELRQWFQVTTHSCHLRLDSSNKQNLKCPAGYVLHIHSLLCSGESPCPPHLQDNIYRCEGASNCDIVYQHQGEQLINTVDYVCVPAGVLDAKCLISSQLLSYFGVLRRANNESKKRNLKTCNWVVNASRDEVVHIIFHYADWINDCKIAVNITYIDCANKKWKTEMFCEMYPNRKMITSCGSVRISSRPTADSYGNYVISYQKQEITLNRKSSIDHDSRSSSLCVLSSDILNARIPIPSLELQKPFSSEDSMNQKFEPSDSIINFMELTEHKDNSSQPGSSFNKPKLIILYTFFGIIILVLSVALIAVIISYHRLSKDNKCSGDSSEKTALWQDTPMETFLTNSLADGSMTSDTIYPLTVDSDADQILATVHHDSIYENNDLDHRLSSGSGISTFLSGKHVSDLRDLIHTFQTGTFVVYDDLNQPNSADETDIGFYQNANSEEMNNIYESIHGEELKKSSQNNNRDPNYKSEMNSRELNPCEDRQSHSCPDDYHYCINNDEYAIVHKPSKPHNDTNQHYDINELQIHSTVNVDFRPTSGPYDKSRLSDIQFSKGDKWKEDY